MSIIFFFSCEKKSIDLNLPEFRETPIGFDYIEEPQDNGFTQERWQLGKKLFYDPIMSVDSSVSCASCHKPELAFSDDQSVSIGVEGRKGTRNTPSLTNVAYHPYFTREGGVPTLEMQVLVPLQEHNEFDFNIVLLAERLRQDSLYNSVSYQAYNQEPSAFVITRALACFERTIISGYSRYDQYVNYNLSDALTDSEIRGMELFFSDKTSCYSCHSGFNFTNYNFENNGIYLEYNDPGRERLTGDAQDNALFKVPSLRNIEITGPYMHDGSMTSLEQVIEHYNSGGKDHPQKNNLVRPLNLSDEEKSDLVNFLYSLTDEMFLTSEYLNN